MSTNCEIKKAVPDPMAILIEILSSKFVDINKVNKFADQFDIKERYTSIDELL